MPNKPVWRWCIEKQCDGWRSQFGNWTTKEGAQAEANMLNERGLGPYKVRRFDLGRLHALQRKG